MVNPEDTPGSSSAGFVDRRVSGASRGAVIGAGSGFIVTFLTLGLLFLMGLINRGVSVAESIWILVVSTPWIFVVSLLFGCPIGGMLGILIGAFRPGTDRSTRRIAP